MTFRPKLLVLDMAGTTVQDDGLVLECFVQAAAAVGLEVTPTEINDRMGQSKISVFSELATRQLGEGPAANELRDMGYDVFRRILEAAYTQGGVSAIAGAQALFHWARSEGIKVALNTGFYQKVTDIIVDHLGWRHEVDAVICSDDVVAGRPFPYMIHEAMQRTKTASVRDTVVVGDTPSDMAAGLNAGAFAVVGVGTGAHGTTALRAAGATHVIASIRELLDLTKRLERLSSVTPRRALAISVSQQ